MARHVFLSYSHLDTGYVERLRTHLTANGLELWTDHGIPLGAEWAQTIETALRDCAAFVPIMSPRSRAAEWVRNEILLAMQLKKPILPLLLDGDRFLELLSRQDEDITGGRLPSPEFIAQLRTLTGTAPTPSAGPAPTPPLTDAPLYFQGLYHTLEGSYLRFYATGEVISVGSTGNPTEVARWFTRQHPGVGMGKYQRRGTALTFSERSTSGTVDWHGVIDGDQLRLHWFSHINQRQGDESFAFVPLPSLPRD